MKVGKQSLNMRRQFGGVRHVPEIEDHGLAWLGNFGNAMIGIRVQQEANGLVVFRVNTEYGFTLWR